MSPEPVAADFGYYHDEHPDEIEEWVERVRRAAGHAYGEWQASRRS